MASSASSTRFGVPVPRAGPGVCSICHGPARDGGADCWCCRTVGLGLGSETFPRPVVVPVSLCRPGDPLHRALRGYKDAPVVAARHHFAARIVFLLADFVAHHTPCIEGTTDTSWDGLAVVPSSTRPSLSSAVAGCRRDSHPLAPIVRSAFPGTDSLVELERGGGASCHLQPDPLAFDVVGDVTGRRVLVIDDTWVTGARMRSAADALRRAGAHVVALVVLGRLVDPGAVSGNARWWSWAESSSRREGAVARGPCCLKLCRLVSPAQSSGVRSDEHRSPVTSPLADLSPGRDTWLYQAVVPGGR